jgi:hypothetical protein
MMEIWNIGRLEHLEGLADDQGSSLYCIVRLFQGVECWNVGIMECWKTAMSRG